MPFVTVDGVRLHYLERGRGDPLVLLHGNGTMNQDFMISGIVDRLAGSPYANPTIQVVGVDA